MEIRTGLDVEATLLRLPIRNIAFDYFGDTPLQMPMPELNTREVWALAFRIPDDAPAAKAGTVIRTMIVEAEPQIIPEGFVARYRTEVPDYLQREDYLRQRKQYGAPDDASSHQKQDILLGVVEIKTSWNRILV